MHAFKYWPSSLLILVILVNSINQYYVNNSYINLHRENQDNIDHHLQAHGFSEVTAVTAFLGNPF